jgi:hypothetical protein
MYSSSWKQTIKNIVFLWGAISLSIVILIISALFISNNCYFINKGPEKSEESIHESTFGDIKLGIVRKYGTEPEVLINLTRKDKKIISNYLLPTQETGTDFDVIDSLVIPWETGKYHIMLFAVNGEFETSNLVWFLSFDGDMKLIRVDNLFEMRRPKSDKTSIIGNKRFALVHPGGFEQKRYSVPVEIKVAETIMIAPLLNDRGINLMKADFEKDLAGRREKLENEPDQSNLEVLDHLQQKFNESLSKNTIPW